jgi:hypothetical protein
MDRLSRPRLPAAAATDMARPAGLARFTIAPQRDVAHCAPRSQAPMDDFFHDDEYRTIVERIVEQDLDENAGRGRPLSSRARQTQRSIDAYLKAGVRPRWMERIADVDAGIARERRRLAEAHRALREEYAGDAALFARCWRERAESWSFDRGLNELIAQHNEWYPIERDLPINPRTGEYVRVGGRSFRRPELGPAWALEQFPPED